jgi:hypothetical protein
MTKSWPVSPGGLRRDPVGWNKRSVSGIGLIAAFPGVRRRAPGAGGRGQVTVVVKRGTLVAQRELLVGGVIGGDGEGGRDALVAPSSDCHGGRGRSLESW